MIQQELPLTVLTPQQEQLRSKYIVHHKRRRNLHRIELKIDNQIFPLAYDCGGEFVSEKWYADQLAIALSKLLEAEQHNPLCDCLDINPDGIHKPCNCKKT
jgi:hypothetical protein